MRSMLILTASLVILHQPAVSAPKAKPGLIYRPSLGIYQTPAQARRAGVKIKRYAKPRVVKRVARPRVRVTYENHVWNWVYDNREMLIRTAPEARQ